MSQQKQQTIPSHYRISRDDFAIQQVYFISFCVWHSQNLLGSVEEDLQLNKLGRLVVEEWNQMAVLQPGFTQDAYIVMPNHFHAIAALPRQSNAREGPEPDNEARVGTIIQAFKTAARKRVNDYQNTPEAPLWQPNYHTRSIRNYRSLEAFRRYIVDNPACWPVDPLNPDSPNPHPSCYITPRDAT